MRVLLLSPSNRMLGARQSLLELVTHLPAGVEPLVICPGEGELYRALGEQGIPAATIPHFAWRKFPSCLGSLFVQLPKLSRAAARFFPQMIHANEFHSVPVATRLRWTSPQWGAAARVVSDGIISMGRFSAPVVGHVRLSITPKQIKTYNMAKCRRVVCVSNAVGALFRGSGLESRVRVVYNGVATGELVQRSQEIPRSAPVAGGEVLTVGLLGLVSERKNQLLAAEAVALARRRGAPVRLVLAGDPFKSSLDYAERLRERLQAEDLRDAVEWLPFQRDVIPVYHRIDINLLISTEEGFGRTIVEAGALGIPSIGSRIGGIPELIDEGRTGWLVGIDKPDGLADLLVELAQTRAAVRERGEAMRTRVESQFTVEAMARNMVSVWEEAAAESHLTGG